MLDAERIPAVRFYLTRDGESWRFHIHCRPALQRQNASEAAICAIVSIIDEPKAKRR
jgi:hypothetical protein